MGNASLKIAEVRPWWLRLFFLGLLGSPLMTSGILHRQLHEDHFFRDLAYWTAYAVFIWLLVALCVGLKTLTEWLMIASISAMTILITGAIFRKLGVWETLQKLVASPSTTDSAQDLMDLIFRFIMILVATPFALLIISSFPATDLMRWVSRQGATRTATVALVGAIFLRMLQHVGEVVTRCMLAWEEENPAILLPRYSADWAGSVVRKIGILEWVKVSVVAWCSVIAIHSLAAVPTVVKDFRRVREAWNVETGGKRE